MTRKAKVHTPILIDSREQKPYQIPGQMVALDTGDYSLEGYEDQIAIERKTRNDMLGCIGQERERFTRELERLSDFDLAVIILECNFEDMLNLPDWSELQQAHVFGSILSWIPKYDVVFFFAGDRRTGQRATKKILEKFQKYERENKR